MSVHDKITLPETIFGDDFTALRSMVTTATPKLTIPSPSMVHYRGGPAAIDPSAYADMDEFWNDLSAAYTQQVKGVADLGESRFVFVCCKTCVPKARNDPEGVLRKVDGFRKKAGGKP